MRTLLLLLFSLLVFIPQNIAKDKDKENKTTKTPSKEPLQYVGCFKDNDPRDLPQRVFHNEDTVASCVKACKNMKYRFAGIQFAYLCFCGNLHGRFGQLPNGRCDSECRKKNDTQCGGKWANSIFRTGYEPLAHKHANKHTKRDNVVMFDNPMQYQNADDRTFTIDVAANKHSDVPGSGIRTQRSYGSTGPNYQYDQYYANQYGNKNYNSYNTANNNNQYAATTKSDVPSNYTKKSYNNGYPQQTNTDQQNSAPPESSSSQYPSQSASNATSPVYGGAKHPQSNSYETPNVYSNGQYGTKATSNSPSMGNTQADNAANYGEHHFNAVPENNSQQQNGYVISVTLHEDNTTAGAETPSAPQSDANNQYYPTNAGYPNAAQSVQQNNNIESVAQASAVDNAGSSQGQAYAASSSYSSQPAAAPSSAAQDKIQGVQQNNNIESVAQASAVDNSQAQSYAASSSYSSQPAGSTQTQTNNYGSQATPSAAEQIVSSVTSASATAENTQTAAQPQDATVQEVVSQASTSSSSPTTNYDAPSSEPKTPCTIERKMAQHMEDTFKPVCTKNGDYGEVQCFEHKGYGKQCWCVDENGQEKKGTRAYGDQKPACSNQDKAESQCERERKIASSTLIPDIYVPVCDSQGNFVAVQCFDHRTYGKQCWCVDGSGQEIKGTRTHKGAEPNCDNTHPVAVQPMTCKQAPYGCCSDGISAAKGPNMEGCLKTQQTERKVSKCKQEQDQATSGAVDIFIPDCKSNGQYNEVQCYSFPVSGKTQCWCVNSDTGVEQPGTRLDEQQPNCQQAATTTKPLTTAARPPALVVCMVTVHKCCPDGVTAAKGPNYEGCPGPTTPAHVPSITSPTVPLGSANEVCVTVRFMQVWYPQLTNRFGMYYLQLEKTLEKSLRDIYRVHPDFLHVHFSEARPETNPLHPTGPKALAVFFVLFFRRLVADPLATIRDSIDEDHKLAGRVVFPMTLRNLGIPYKHLGCPQEHYKPINPVISKPHPAPSGTIATSKPVVTTAAPITTPSPPSTANPCGQCLTTATCPTHCPPPVSTKPPAPPTTSPNTPPPTKSPNTPPPTTAPPLTLPQVTTPSAGAPTCGPCITPPNCPPACPVTHPTALPQTTAPPPLPPQTTAPPLLPPQTTAPPLLPPQTTGSPALPPQTTTPSPLPPQTTPHQQPCAPSPCPTLPCPPPCPVTPPQTTLPPTTATTATTPTPSTPTTPTTPKETTPTTKAPETTPTTKPTKPQGPPVDGGYTPWTEWTECSVTCDGGVQQRTRTCTSPEPKDGGKDCKALGESFETKGCNTRPCPVDGGYSNWSPFEECSATCGGGHQVRSRKCDKPEPMYGGQNCSRLGAAKETRPCNTFYCPIHGNFSDWSDYMACSVTCGEGLQYNMRTCTNPPPQHGGNDCSALGPSRISRACNTQDCPVDGGYSPFSKFSDCTATCGGGNQIRTRTCVNPPPRHGGDDCSKDGPDFETRECNTQLCPVDGAFTTFSDYSTCSKTCGGGNQVRVRSCTNPEPQFGGKNCTGTWKETKSCNTQPCPVDGGFGEWGNYSECEVSCGGGTQMRMRTCTNPAPGNGGKTCKGKTTETKDCNVQPCPVNGGYNDWSSYGPCSSSCGGGSQQRTRECTNPPPSQGGRSCGIIGPSHETRNCSTNPCPIHGEYTKWTKWSDCSKPCGGGVIKRTRNCTNPPPEFGGKDCSALGPEQETQDCNLMQCPIDGNYSSWAEWSSCTVTCGSGEHMRSRTCTNPPPEFGGKDCTPLGKSTESTTCNTQSCPIHGGYSPWSDWSKCSVICGEGHQYRSRKCSSPTPEFGGADCSDLGSPTDTKACVLEPCPTEPPNIPPEKGWNLCSKSCGGGVQWRNIELDGGKTKNETRTCASDPCPIDGGYSPWSNWTQCSVSCGGGVTSRSRTCTEPIPMFGGQRCEAPDGPVQTKHCSMQICPPPKIPIRSCREFYERCHKRSDGLYSIYVNEKITASEMTVYCDMTQSQGGWTLILTAATNQGWNDATVKGRNEDQPSLVQDYSILDKANAIKSNSLGPFLYRLEAHERGNYGGIWSAPQSYSFISSFANQTGVTEVEKFDPTWNYGPTTLGLRMPWLPPDDEYALLTTSDRLGKEWFGTLVAMKPLFKPAPWMLDTNMNNPRLIWYWLKEAPSLLKPPSDIEADTMCPSPVPGGYGQWGAWSSCPRSCGGGMQIRTRNCTSPEPLNGGEDCSEVGPNVETKECNPLPCPGATVNGGYTPWSEWTECTATCGGGSQMRTRKCADPTPQNGGKSCIDQGLGNEIETRKCNLQSCPSPCSPPCKNGGQCIDNHCKCPPGLYEGTYCQTAICKKPCQNGGTCVDPLENLCICQPQWGGDTCDKPICTKYCKNGGTCTALNTCTCQPGYSGSRCEKSNCEKECVNGGRCVNGVCQCLSGYSGLACEIVDRCSLPTPIGPCFAALQDIVKKTTPKEFETPCMTYLREVYQTCSSKSTPEMTVDLCDQQCEHRPGVCSKVWATESCPSWEDKYYYDTATAQCKGIRFNGCLGNHNLFSRMESCTKGCASGGNFGPRPTVVTPTVPSKHPPVPTSYYWYFLTVSNNQVSGSPPLDIKGSYRFIDLGYFFNSKDSWVETQLTNEDGLLDPDKLTAGLSIGLKIKLDGSMRYCQEPRYLVDTGSSSLQTRGLSIFVVGRTLSVQITTSKNIYKVYTNVVFGLWKYLMITWKPSAGINVYLDGEKATSSDEPLSANNPPINVQTPNFAVGRKLGPVGGTCGKFYLSSLAVFKQFVDNVMVRRIYQFFWFNIVSQSPPPTFYIRLSVTNKAGQAIIIRSGDDMPAEGFKISANVIAVITKTVPGNIATTFTAYGTDGRRLQMNQKALIELNPSPTKEYAIPILIGKPAVVMRYHLYMQITNMAKRDIRILRRVAIDETPKEFTVKSNAIANVDLKLNSSDPVTVSVVDNEYKPLFINFKPSLVLTPTEVIGIAIPLTITASSSPTLNFVIKLSLANYVGGDVIIKSSDGDPKEGLHAKSGKKTLVTKKVGSPNSFTLNAVNKETGVAVAINNAASLVVTPWAIDAKDKDFVVINITKGIVKPKPQSNVYSIYLVVSNNLGRNVILIPSDNKPFDGFEIPVRTIVIISKICNDTKPVDFIAVDPATETMVLVNGTERQKVTPNNDGRPVSLQITAPEGSAENPVVPSVRPAYYWSFYTLNNGTVLGSPPFSARGNVQIDNDGIFLDGISAYLGSHMNSDDALVYPERFSKGISFSIKVKFPDSVLEYTVPKYLIDSGAKSLSSRGVSLYFLEKRLVAELATSDKTWKTEADISGSTNRWLYVMVSWSQERGLTLYVDGVERGGDSGGLDTSGKEAAPQEENLRIGRNIGAEQANFASFFLSSFAIFRQDVPAPMAFQVYKYYITKAIIQPSKMYYISLYVNNTMDKEVELVSNDGHPPGGVHLQPKQILVIRKEIAASTFVLFTAEDVNTGGDLLINDEGEYVATPSEYKQQLITLTITDAGSIGKPAPRDRYYATLILKNKCKTNAVIISNDNHPSDGYRIAPGSQETLTKEVLTPGDIVVRAFDPSTSRTLLINGEESYVVTPTREKANPDGLEITSSGEDDSPSSSPPIPYSHYWSLNSINKGFVEGNPAFKVNGEVLVKDGGITFDGESAWLGASVDREGCLLNPGNCIEGFSIGTKLKFDGVPDNEDDRYIIDTGAQSTARRGVSLFIAKNGKLSFVLATAERTWMTSTPVIPNRWFYLIVMWSRNDGLSMYIDNQLKSSVRNGRPNAEEKLPTIEQTNLNIGRNINGQSGAYNANFEMASLVVFNRNIPTQSITPVTSYFSKSLPVQPLTKYYIMLNVTNRATSNIILEPSDKYPSGGFTISHKSIATIKKEVSKPSAVSFVARIEGQSNKFILLNGKPRISVTPSETPLDMFEVNVSPEGETVDGPIEGEPEEDGVKAPPVHPDQSWLLADLDGGIVPGNPALAASGNVARIDGGLEFDGVTAYLSGMLAPNQCLLDLDRCSEGFSFGIKMKFKTSSLTVNSPRYVVDSGRTAKARGIAVYLVMKELFVEIATSTTLYKGAVTVQGDRWFFLMATWSRKTGMTLYMDGLPIAMVPEGITSMGYPVSTTSPNFAIGRSATSNSYFADVSISSFSTFHLLLSPNNVKALSNFFWIRGSEGEGNTFYVVLKVVNPLPITAVVLSDDGLPNEGIRIPPNGVATIVKTVKSSGSIAFSATNRAGNGSYYLNNRDIIRVLATRSKDVVTRAVLATTGVDTPSLVDASKIKFFRAPPVFARHSWSFNTISIKAKKVPGTPPLSAYGVFAKGNGGLMFDGKTNWLGGHLESPDCATDPDQCYSGFSLATKLYLDESVSSYIEPKYLIDTGASSTKSRGISIYVMGGSLYCELASANKVWMITQNVDAGVWMFVGITWSPANGLILYINGARVGADAAGRVASGRTINFSGENLVIGRDVTKGGTHYSKFIMASLLTIESFFSPAIMRAVYSFYWRHGGTTSKGFVALRLRNQAGVDALITTSDNIPAQGLSLPHLYPVILEKQIATGSAISLAAKESLAKTPLLLNNQQSVSVSDSVRGYQIIVTKPKNTVKFYFSIKIMNPTAQNIVLKSSDNDPKEGYPVKSKTAKMITKSVASNLPITFTAVDSVTGKPVKLSGEEKKTITPTAKKGEKMETFTVQGAPQAQFFIKVKIINRSGKNVQLQLPLPGQAPVNVKKNVAMVITKGTSSNAPITITATDEDKKPIAVNGKKSIVLTPSKTKQEVAITLSPNTVNGKKKGVIPDHVQSVYYVTLRAKNKIRSKVFAATSVKDSAHGFHFGSSSDMQITKEYISDHPVKLRAFDAKTRNSLLMNGKLVLLVRPGAFSDPATRIEITRPVGNVVTPVTEHFITLMLNNKLHRQVRLIPSKGKKGGYIVGPASSLKVHLIIKGGPAMPNPISFKAEDVQTESTLEINEKVTPLSVTPAEMSDVMTYFNITAPAPSVKPQHSWSMASLKGSHIFGSPSMHAHGFYRYVDDGLSFDGSDTYMTTVLPKHDVLVNPDNSDKGFTIAAKIRFGKEAMEYQDEPRFILDSGGHHKGKRGVSLYIDSGKIFAEVQSLDRIWTVSKPLLPDVWMYLTVTWNKKDGLKMYRESVLRADDDMGRSTGNSTVIDLEENLTLGRNIGNDGNLRYAKFDLSSLTTFGEALNQTDIDKAFIFFSCGASAKIFYAPIRITNDVGRDIIIKPSKGNDKGFHMVPRSTLEVTLMSMSTDGNTPNPVLFTAIDANTKIELEVNNSPRPFPVTPTESMEDFTTMVVAVPQPSVTPTFAWSLQKVRHGKVLGAMPTINAFGELKEHDGGLQLDGKDSWLDAGDFKGRCLSDPQRCPSGFTIGLKIKLDGESSKYVHEPHYIIDTGGSSSNGRGLSLYVKNRKVYVTVTQSNSAWRVEAPYTLNKWEYVLITWRADSGLSLYLDGTPVAASEAVIAQQGEHLEDSITHLAVGRNAAGPPYGSTKMAISSLVFFEHHVRPLDAQKISMYYWSSVSQSSSDRFIKVRFDNRAGVPIRVIPSKGDSKKQGYTIQPHMNLQLSYVEKGPFNNIPVTFLAENAVTNERLYINGRLGNLRVLPSPTKTDVTEAVVASSYKCPISNGFFADPTSNARYIHCTDRAPTVMTCPDQMTWRTDINSCAGEGRESSNLYYYNVRFNNYAGSEAEIIKTTGHKQRNVLPSGKALHVKFTTTKKHASVFRAIYADTGDTLRLNDFPMLQVYPSDNPNKVTEVTVSKPAFFYTIETKTGSEVDADTQANVFIKLIGEDGETPEMALAHKGVTHFKLGGLDKFRVEATDIGKIKEVSIKHDDWGESPNWYLEKINIRDKNGRPYEFKVNSWLDSKQGDHVTVKQLVSTNPLLGHDQCTPSCINNGSCIDGKCQCSSGYEGEHCQHAVCDIPCLNGGTCISPDSNKCACPDGYTGKYCDKPVCADYCRNGGTCSGPNKCTCPKGYVGLRCETSRCLPDCMNGGQCVDGLCECPLGHSGKYCEQVSVCDLPSDPGPCFHEIFKAASKANKQNRTSACIRYLDDVLQSCTANNGSFNMHQCSKICEPEGEENVCKKIWEPGQCTSLLTKYTFDKESGLCQPMIYNGCLGNRNSFDSTQECTSACSAGRKRRAIRNSTQEQKPKLLKNLLHKSFHHIKRHVSYK